MPRKDFFIIVLVPFFMILGIGCAQSTQGTSTVEQAPSDTPDTSPKDASPRIQGRASQDDYPGMLGKASQGTRWVRGHYEAKEGQRVWIRGHNEPIAVSTLIPSSVTPQRLTPSQSESDLGPDSGAVSPGEELVTPSSGRWSGSDKQWTPGHYETKDGKEVWVRGHYASKEGSVAGPPAKRLNVQTADQATPEETTPSAVKPQGWAVVIGISKYKYAAGKFPELHYAAKDAEAFYKFLRSPEGGGFPAERIYFLQDELATLENIKYAFFDFLKHALEEDYVMVYFAGHGTPEKDNPDNLYLVAYDTKPDRITSTAFAMWDIETAFSRHIKSERVIMFADACHSAGINGDITTRFVYKKNMVNKCLLEVAQSKQGRAIFTASEAGELSQESKQWGGGHGVFTYFLIQGLKGKADINENNIVTLGEVIDFVSENVRRATNNTQHPDTAGIFDRELPLVVSSR